LGELPGHQVTPFGRVVPNSLDASVLLCCICHIRVVFHIGKDEDPHNLNSIEEAVHPVDQHPTS